MDKYGSLRKKAAQIRRDIIDMVYRSAAGHVGGSLSETDILVSLYYCVLNVDPKNPLSPDRDRFLLSKGHSIDAYYCVLADKGFFPKDDLKSYSQFSSKYIGHIFKYPTYLWSRKIRGQIKACLSVYQVFFFYLLTDVLCSRALPHDSVIDRLTGY
jgi:transketolase N-terminal domain/subunit